MRSHPRDTKETRKLREKLVRQLWRKDRAIQTRQVASAFRAVPRHLFVPEVDVEDAYSDQVIPLKFAENQAISSSSQPGMMAIMLEQLALEPGMRVLEIGAGSGYNAALMAHIVGETGSVISIDIDDDLVEGARANLQAAMVNNVQVLRADGAYGYAPGAPYDRIILTVASADVTPAWREQLLPHGLLVLPLILTQDHQISTALEYQEGVLTAVDLVPCRFMTLRGDFAMADQEMWQVLNLADELQVYVNASTAVTGDDLHRLLEMEKTIVSTGVELLPQSLFDGRLWMSLNQPETILARVEGKLRQRRVVPCLFGNRSYCTTNGLVAADGLALWARRYRTKPEKDQANPFELTVRAHGEAGGELAQRLVTVAQAWDGAGRPGSDEAHLAVYPHGTPVPDRPGQTILLRETVQIALWFN